MCPGRRTQAPVAVGSVGRPYGPPVYKAEMSVDYAVDFHPVTIKVTKTNRIAKARVLRDGRPWAGKVVKATAWPGGLGR